MAITEQENDTLEPSSENAQIASFEVKGLFGYLDHRIEIPQISDSSKTAEVSIIEGENGTGKTTILKMISGIVNGLDFDPFRLVPFRTARLTLTNGHFISVRYDEDEEGLYPIEVSNPIRTVRLGKDRSRVPYRPDQAEEIQKFRDESLPILKTIIFNLITIERSLETESDDNGDEFVIDPRTGQHRPRSKLRPLSNRVRIFLREAQVNYRRFFQAEQLDLLPRLLKSFQNLEGGIEIGSLLSRIEALRTRNSEISRFGLQSDEMELATLHDLILSDHSKDVHSLSALASYVEIHESRSDARDLIATRLSLFETIMDEFLVGKEIRINYRTGLEITSKTGKIVEDDLSSGEFHFLYMMVTALLCKRTGTIIAIDEPELSLHVKWQRKLVTALSKCSSGAAPVFLLATHSIAISAAHADSVQRLSAID